MDNDGFTLVKKKERNTHKKNNKKKFIFTEKQDIDFLNDEIFSLFKIKILINKKINSDMLHYIFSFLTGYDRDVNTQIKKFYNEKYLKIKNVTLNMKKFFHCECCSYDQYCKYYRRISSDKICIGNYGIELKHKCEGCHCCDYIGHNPTFNNYDKCYYDYDCDD